MQIELRTDKHIEGHDELARYVDTVVGTALERFDRITRVEAHVGDVSSPANPGEDDIRCMLEAHVAGLPPVAVTHQAATVHEAVRGSAAKLRHAVDSLLDRHADRLRSG